MRCARKRPAEVVIIVPLRYFPDAWEEAAIVLSKAGLYYSAHFLRTLATAFGIPPKKRRRK